MKIKYLDNIQGQSMNGRQFTNGVGKIVRRELNFEEEKLAFLGKLKL
jgi:hypothetical protein